MFYDVHPHKVLHTLCSVADVCHMYMLWTHSKHSFPRVLTSQPFATAHETIYILTLSHFSFLHQNGWPD